ncbi:hypothetical protein [Allocoleopsis franciscana]|uniref:hypothetical protein n=1 Tax=Allocoleopsis franciscana TaxID=2886352 RepID=UPI0012DDFF35|nr:hypothetical protein [Allocoleopsis franciscana]
MKQIFRRSAERDWGDWSGNHKEVWQRSPAIALDTVSHPSKSLVIHCPIISYGVVEE